MCRDQTGGMRFGICAFLGGQGLVPAVTAQRPILTRFASAGTWAKHTLENSSRRSTGFSCHSWSLWRHTQALQCKTEQSPGQSLSAALSPFPIHRVPQRWLALLNISHLGSAEGGTLPCSSVAIKGCSSCCSGPSGLLSLCDRPLLEMWLGNWKQEPCSGIAWLADWGCSSSTGQANLLC